MPQATLADVRAALNTSLNGISGLQNTPYMLSTATPPTSEIQIGEITYHGASGATGAGLDELLFVVRVFVPFTTDIGAQRKLDQMMDVTGTSSIKNALEADTTLGGLVDSAHVTSCSGVRIFQRDGLAPSLGAEWAVTVRMGQS